jgi:3-methyladenine DNA glycosylase AlkD
LPLKDIQIELEKLGNPETVAFIQKMAPGVKEVYGVKMPVLHTLVAQYKAEGFPLIEALWKSGAFEERILAAKLLEKNAVKDPAKALKLVEKFSEGIDNWPVCDAIGMQSLRGITKTHPDEIFALAEKLNNSSNFWKRRLSLVLVEWFTREKKYHPYIKKLIATLKDDREYYVKKAVQWLNKNLAKGK